MALTRRGVLAGSAAGGLLLAAGPAGAKTNMVFAHGVASGDPHADSVLLWTRVTDPAHGPVSGTWEMAEDELFTRIAARGSFSTSAARDHTVKVIASGLKAGREYFYRFRAMDTVSAIGRAKTLPTGRIDRLDIVLACCAMYMFGEFHAYRAIADREAVDLILFVGDYIYEYGANSMPALMDVRAIEPTHDTVTLADYRARYAQWRRDPALRDAHARASWICMWDDHEIANDDWMHGAQHHDPAANGDWELRKAAAVQAYLEWMPIRDPDTSDPYGITRSFAFGDLATLALPETRLKARQQQLSLARDLDWHVVDRRGSGERVISDPAELKTLDLKALPQGVKREPDVAAFRKKLADPAREMLGAEQCAWLADELKAHKDARRPWFLFGSATILSSYVYPDLTKFPDGKAALAPMYALTRYGLPLLNVDSWDGYAGERDKLYDQFEKSGANLLVLSGDSHMAWINEPHRGERRMGLELSASTLTGPSIGELLLPSGPVGEAFVHDNRDICWCDTNAVGFVTVSLTRDRVEADFVRVLTPRQASGKLDIARHASARIAEDGLSGWEIS
ncbi:MULTISPECIES: alkaline phosphatase D family protein [Sphingobium]|uniref:Phosphodiesterase n=2 Tax=Sphingomonadaceae TaxID=41297 RepID=A0A5J5IA65_9SPHN|nr:MULTISPECIES: alkaline phosphatase D family protein [Sphingobium]KAA9020031.1 phosphodiesterase [Sphingobium limneticum]KAA9021489.1 phosphodiesterase [Sphingobium limneticum]KAA9033851.1 phosphodiesterase [Sphingobium limneticum]BBD03329.1 alkaline phosphatase D [Sphingobium sp. YG1]